MTDDIFELVESETPIVVTPKLVLQSLSSHSPLHFLLPLYLALRGETTRGVVEIDIHALAQALDMSDASVRRGVRLLTKLALLRPVSGARALKRFAMPATLDAWATTTLRGLLSGVLAVDVGAETLTHQPTGNVIDGSKRYVKEDDTGAVLARPFATSRGGAAPDRSTLGKDSTGGILSTLGKLSTGGTDANPGLEAVTSDTASTSVVESDGADPNLINCPYVVLKESYLDNNTNQATNQDSPDAELPTTSGGPQVQLPLTDSHSADSHSPPKSKAPHGGKRKNAGPKPRVFVPADEPDVWAAWTYWRDLLYPKRATPTTEDASRIRSRLREGATVDELKAIFDYAKEDRWLSGKDPASKGKRYDTIQVLLNSRDKFEKYRDQAEQWRQGPKLDGRGIDRSMGMDAVGFGTDERW